jgi:hypothetical protein
MGSNTTLMAVIQELVTVSKESGASLGDLIAAAEGNELRRIADALDRVAYALEDSQADRERNTDLSEQLVKIVRGAMAAHFNTAEMVEAATRACADSPEPPLAARPVIHDDGCAS